MPEHPAVRVLFMKAVLVKLSHKRREVVMLEIRRENVTGKLVGLVHGERQACRVGPSNEVERGRVFD